MIAPTTHPSVFIESSAHHPAPRLESGDRLTRTEFERRYAAMPKQTKSELIEGVVIMASPVSNKHSEANSLLSWWLVGYSMATKGTRVGDNATVLLDLDNEVQPDILLRLLREAGGASRVAGSGYIEGAPELIAEIAASSVSCDYHVKRHVYRRNGVREYLIWRVDDAAIDWFTLEEGEYLPLAPDESGVIRSKVFPGLWLAGQALLAGDLSTVLATLRQGAQSEAHTAFAAELTQRLATTR